ncbi:hypothetical protein [Rodentibacter caecimuris]|uniref:Uncharacterized protein n=1 Tax=Rodentibacter caecimuris TaxID=1796644 RepID=A0ABX3KYB6_9PAST|nr:hypothetical protein BKG89_03775 [Rodentibacter heylii]
MGLYSVEQNFFTIEQFISNFKQEYDKKISIDNILDFFENEKISLFLFVKKNEDEIKIANSVFKDDEISVKYSRNELDKTILFHSNKKMEAMNVGLFQFETKDYIKNNYVSLYNDENKHHSISGITNSKLYYENISEYTSTNLLTKQNEKIEIIEKQEILILNDCFYSGYFKIPKGKIKLPYLIKPEMIPEKLNAIIESLLPELEIYSHYEFLGNEDLKKSFKTSTINIFIPNYLDKLKIDFFKNLYISKDDIERIKEELDLLSIFDTRKPNNESDYEMYQSIINALVFMHHPKFQKVNRKDFFITDRNRPSFNAISEAISDILEEMESKMGYSGKVRKAKTIAPFLEKFLERSQYY